MTRARTVAEVIAGEAVSGTPEERMADMRAIASVIANRAALLGVPQQEVVANQSEFNIYGQPMPAGTTNLVDMAQEAIDYVAQNGPTTTATFYATPEAVPNLPGGLSFETETTGHQYFTDPQNRAIYTQNGLVAPNPYAYAANLTEVPTPAINPSAIPTANPAFLAGAQLEDVDPNLALAVPDPLSNLPAPDLATAQSFERAAPATNPWGGAPLSNVAASGFLGSTNPLQAGTNVADNGVLPGLQSDGFTQVAAAGPFGGDYAAPEDRFAAPSQAGFLNAPAGQPISQADVQRAMFNVTANGQMDPAFTEAMMGPQNPVVPSSVESQTFTPEGQVVDIASSRFTTPAKTSRIGQQPAFDTARMPGLVNPTTNTAGFLGAPQTPADLGSFPEGVTAQRGPPTGIYSAEFQALQGNTERQLQELAKQEVAPSLKTAYVEDPAVAPALQAIEQQTTVNAPVTGFLGANPAALAVPNFSQAVNPSVPALASTPVGMSVYEVGEIAKAAQVPGVIAAKMQPSVIADVAPTTVQPSAIPSAVATPEQQAAGYQQAAATMAKAGMLNIGQQPPTDLSGNLPTNFDVLGTTTAAAPDLETVSVADQPSIADVEGPATTDAEDQQTTDAATTTTAPSTVSRTTPAATRTQPSFTSRMAKAVNPGTALGALVGGGFLGVPGAVVGGFLGNAAYQNKGFLDQPAMSINNIGSGSEAVYSIWGGGQPPGTQATASDGQQITSMGNGYTAVTGKSGVITVFDSTGKAMSYFGNDLDQDQDAEAETSSSNSGGLFGGLFG